MPNEETIETASGGKPEAIYTDKRGLALMLGLSPRTVSNFLNKGCPHLKIGIRRVRFEVVETRKWLHDTFGLQRRR